MSAPLSCTASMDLGPVENTIDPLSFPSNLDCSSIDDRTFPKSEELRLLVVDASKRVRNACCEVAEGLGFVVSATASAVGAREILNRKETALLLLDVSHSDSGDQSLFEEMKVLYPDTLVIVMSARATILSAVTAMQIGASDYLSKPFPLEVLTQALERAARRWHFCVEQRRLQKTLQLEEDVVDILGKSPEMEKLYRILSNVAKSMHPAMILGESGTGKSLVAKAIHSNGPHASKPFVSLDCKSLGPALVEEELFGAATECSSDETPLSKHGLLTSSQGGTVFLDEVGDLPLELQKRLMSALTSREIQPTRGLNAVRISVRILAATSRDLVQMVKDGLFRTDLYGLLSVVNLRIPPLRGRPDDIAFLAKRFLEKTQGQTGLTRTLSSETLQLLETYDWPDNIRELENTIAWACSRTTEPELGESHFPPKLLDFYREVKMVRTTNHTSVPVEQRIIPISKMEKHAILRAVRETNGDRMMAAELLGISKTTLYRKLKEYGLSEESEPDPHLVCPANPAEVHAHAVPVSACG